jgi:dCMP deaminase
MSFTEPVVPRLDCARCGGPVVGEAPGHAVLPRHECVSREALDGRPPWEAVFLGMAFVLARRSHDAQTQHGCVIATKKNRVLGVGFNGFPRGMRDGELPNTRPEKYPWMRHAERNAVRNCAAKPEGATAYVTGEPCNDCLMDLWEAGVDEVVYADLHGTHLASALDRGVRQTFLRQSGMRLRPVLPDFDWLNMLAVGLQSRVLGRRDDRRFPTQESGTC